MVTLLAVLLCLLLIGIEPIKKALTKEQATPEERVETLVKETKREVEKRAKELKREAEKQTTSDKLQTTSGESHPDGKLVEHSSSLVAEKPVARSSSPIANEELVACASSLAAETPSKVMKRKGYTLSYNRETKQPNWVAWRLDKQTLLENESRTNKFLPDPDLSAREAVTTVDYKGSGYDRGHMCPAADSRWHWKAMQESFYMSNICPQNHKLNGGDWKELEDACRRWAEQWGTLYVVCGPIFYRDGKPEYIGREQKVRVPDAFFKVVLCTEPMQAIGFVYKNHAANKKMSSYINSVDEVERITGYDFFPTLPDDVERLVESSCLPQEWRIK